MKLLIGFLAFLVIAMVALSTWAIYNLFASKTEIDVLKYGFFLLFLGLGSISSSSKSK